MILKNMLFTEQMKRVILKNMLFTEQMRVILKNMPFTELYEFFRQEAFQASS